VLVAASAVTGLAGVVAAGQPAGAAKLTKPVSILLLAETKGESVNAVQYYDNGAKLAVQELGPKKVTYTRIPAPLTPAQAQTALLQAIDQHPDAIIGLPASSQVIPLAPTIAQAQVPFFSLSSAIQVVRSAPGAPQNLNEIRPINTDIAYAQTNYVLKDLKAKKIGLVCVQNSYAIDSCNVARPLIAAAGATISVERSNSTAATDLTDIALAMKQANVDAVLDYNFPNPLGVLANQLVQNGVTVPHIDGASTGIEVNAGVITGQAADLIKSIGDCNPLDPKTKQQKAFLAAYKAAYSESPIYSAAEVYDMVHLIYAAAQKAGTTDPVKLEKAITTITYQGVCQKYHADSAGVLSHTSVFEKWNGGVEKTIKQVNIPVAGAPGSQVTTTPAAGGSTTSTTTAATSTTSKP
jgi:branched-chain amino acid transport system substrate-binding protein